MHIFQRRLLTGASVFYYESPVSKQRRNGLLADRADYALETPTGETAETAQRGAIRRHRINRQKGMGHNPRNL